MRLVSVPVRRMIVAVTGASGAIYAVRSLDVLRAAGVETHLVVTKSGSLTSSYETGLDAAGLARHADVTYHHTDVGAPVASGSFLTAGMLVAPASMRTLGEIASGVSGSLVSRAADVVLKERRPLVLLTREAPLSLVHLRNMSTVTEAGGTIFPPVPAFYHNPSSLEEIVDHTVGRALDQFGIHTDVFPRWDADLRASRHAWKTHGSGDAPVQREE